MKVLVTGAGGYLGNVLVPYLREKDILVFPVDLGIFKSGNIDIIKRNIVTDSLDDIFDMKLDAVVHLAGISNDPSCELDQEFTREVNVIGNYNLVNTALKYKVDNYVLASSASVYGYSKGLAKETDELNPQSLYAETKIYNEEYLLSTLSLAKVLRFGTLYGVSPKMRLDIAINIMVRNAVLHNKIDVFGGEQMRPFLHVKDAARAVYQALLYDKSLLTNVVDFNDKIIDLAYAIKNEVSPLALVNIANKSTDTRNYALDDSHMYEVFKFCPLFGFKDVNKIAKWSIEHKDDMNNSDFYTIQAWKEWISGKAVRT